MFYLCCWHLLNLFIEHLLNAFAHQGNGMIGTIEGYTVLKDEPYIAYEFVDAIVTRIRSIGVKLAGIRGR
jgi:hypothetical protein